MKYSIFATTLIISLILQAYASLHNGYCSSTCIDYTGACFDDTPQGCYVCANTIFNINSNSSSATPCSPADQTTIIAQ